MCNQHSGVVTPSIDLLPKDTHEEHDQLHSASLRAGHRLRIIAGQVESLREMIERGDYCIDVLRRSLAIRDALSDLDDTVLRGHLYKHVITQMRSNEAPRAAEEILAIYQFSKRK